MRETPRLTLTPDDRRYRYYRNAVERHRDPGEFDLSADRGRITALPERGLTDFRRTPALFSAGEQAVTEALAPPAVVLEDPNDRAFVASQVYEEEARGLLRQVPARGDPPRRGRTRRRADRPVGPPVVRRRLRGAVRPRRARDGTLTDRGQVGDPRRRVLPLPPHRRGDTGADRLLRRADELRRRRGGTADPSRTRRGPLEHPQRRGATRGSGMAKPKALVGDGSVDPEFLRETVGELVPLTQSIVGASADDSRPASGRTTSSPTPPSVTRTG